MSGGHLRQLFPTLARTAIERSSQPGELVDPMCGTGTVITR